jgi:hypothetical protein
MPCRGYLERLAAFQAAEPLEASLEGGIGGSTAVLGGFTEDLKLRTYEAERAGLRHVW